LQSVQRAFFDKKGLSRVISRSKSDV